MVPCLHVRFPFVIGEKSSHICFYYVCENLFKMLHIFGRLLRTFSEWEEKP